jgi:TolB-like protein/Tfp pilus assembly protein PilF
VAGFYLVGAWVVLQVGDVIVEPAGLPAWSMTALLYLVIAAFPLAMYIGWRYDITEHGIVRTRPASEGEIEHTDISLKTSDYIILAALVVITGAVIYQLLPGIQQEAVEEQPIAVTTPDILPNSIAVLPFADISQDKDQEYLGDGISDTVMHVLSRVKGLTVTARTSSFAFKDQNLNVREIAEMLRVANVLEGSVQKAGNEVRIIARLIEASSGMELWSGYFDRELSGIFEIQDEIAREVTAALKIAVLDEGKAGIKNRYQPKLESYEQLILGRAALDRGKVADMKAAREHFEKAIELDPNFADPYIDLSYTYMIIALNPGLEQAESAALRRPLVEQALDLDPMSPAAHTALGFLLRDEGKESESTESFKRATELDPNHAAAYAGLGSNAFRRGDAQQSLEYHKKATELDPEQTQFQMYLANAYWTVAQAEKALAIVRDEIRKHPEDPSNYGMMSRWLIQMGRAGEAMKYDQAFFALDPDNPMAWKAVCETYKQLWDEDSARNCMTEYTQAYPEDYDARQKLAGARGDYDEAVRIGQQMIEQSPNWQYRKMQVAFWMSYAHRWNDVINMIGQFQPGLFEPEPQIGAWSLWPATHLAQALIETGQVEQGHAIAAAGIDHILRQRKLQIGWDNVGIEDAMFYALVGERDLMLKSINHAIDNDWMFYSGVLVDSPLFKDYRSDPEFQALVDRQAAKMAEQSAWYETNKDEPL